ncbi:MAG: fibronectin type III domain-containing protein [Ruminococcus flavefaciens]|nr:fibronectin type III domain-containing protein [Ruminococcus flavefaciens]
MNNSDIKRNLKKKTAFLMAVSMVSGFSGTDDIIRSFAADGNHSADTNSGSTEENSRPKNLGQIEVTFASALMIDSVDCKVKLMLNNDEIDEQDVTITNNGESVVSFDDLVDGTYTLVVTAEGFADYVQDIDVESNCRTLRIDTGFCGGVNYVEGGLHNGVILIGDVDGDGDIDDDDKNMLIDEIDKQYNAKNDNSENKTEIIFNENTDLNHDGVTDLCDLSLFSKSYKTDKDTQATIETYASPVPVTMKKAAGTNTEITGSIANVMNKTSNETMTLSAPQNASKENPIGAVIDLASQKIDGMTIETGEDTQIEDAEMTFDCINTETNEEFSVTKHMTKGVSYMTLTESDVRAEIDENGNIEIKLGKQVAIKRVTLMITALDNANGNNNLAEISKVEFVNGMDNRVPEPKMDYPQDFSAVASSKKIKLSWSPCVNVTGYELEVTYKDTKNNKKTVTIPANSNSVTLTTIGRDEIMNYTEYTFRVQSVNGSWKSGYEDGVFQSVTPMPNKKPDKPDNVSVSGDYRKINVSWKKMEDTLSYNVYYKLRNSDDEYTKISGITANKYEINSLQDLTEYEVYVTGVNELGESPQSYHYTATTTDLNLADMPKYNLINRDENGIPGSNHIVSVTRCGGTMENSELDEGKDNTAWGAVDGNKNSYYTKADKYDGGWTTLTDYNGLKYTFDQEYTIDTICILTASTDISFTHFRWWDANGKESSINGKYDYKNYATAQTDAYGRTYYFIRLPYAITASKIQIGLGRYSAPVTVAETYFYHYDSLRNEIMDLFTDDMHMAIRDDVTQELIDELRTRLNTPDEFGEMHFEKVALEKELKSAEKILNAQSLTDIIEIHNGITTNDVGRGFTGINAWQPLGVSLAAEDEVTIYVGHNTKKKGASTNLRLICTQYHTESDRIETSGADLKVGENTFKIPKGKKVSSDYEAGGALYIQYTGNSANDQYIVRVNGGTNVPILDLYKVTDENERLERTVKYVEALDKHVAEMETMHEELHRNSTNKNVALAYDEKNCILGASDIMLDTMMLSLPAKQILAGAGTGSAEDRAKTMLKSMDAMEEMMYLFYQHKGLNASAPDAVDQIPKGHLNIRYQRMFSGAFMYAAGNHIGIEWGSTSGLMRGVPIESDENGKYKSGNYFGWGISHEIGHNINQGAYTVAEITNNYFAQLAQAKDTNEGMRFKYSNIYDKVTSGTKGDCQNIATQLGMYWQLHLAYDKGLNYKTYPDYDEQLANLFYARVDTYARTPSKAPAPNGVALAVNGDTDQNLMRLACAAAEKNVLEFFERWGKTPDADTIKYAEQFEKETRAIYYANDDARVYSLNGESVLGTAGNVKAIENVSAKTGKASNQIELSFKSCNIPEEDILGYEVIRCTISGGRVQENTVGFTTESTFTDTVTTMNNRTVYYKVTLIDKYLNRSEAVITKQLKVEHDGSMDKTGWSVSTKNLMATSVENNDEVTCKEVAIDPAGMIIDHDLNTVYTPKATNTNAEIIIDFNQTLTVSGLKYTAGDGRSIGKYEIYVHENNDWVLVSSGQFNGSKTVYFANADDKYISTYSATGVKVVIQNQKNVNLSIAEIDILGATGDNVDFRRTTGDNTTVIGTLAKDYVYGENEEDVIKKGSLIFTGSYKGNPAYSTIILYDNKGNIVGGIDENNMIQSQQIILADVPDGKDITEVSNGTWIYWIEPDYIPDNLPETVRAELYRVNDAVTNQGQRLVSDTLYEEIPDKLPEITIDTD